MSKYEVVKMGPKDYHVIEHQIWGETPYIVAKCTGVVPASQIRKALDVYESLYVKQGVLSNLGNALLEISAKLKEEIK